MMASMAMTRGSMARRAARVLAKIAAAARSGARPSGGPATVLRGARELQRGDAVAALEMPRQRALVVEAGSAGDLRDGHAAPQVMARALQARLHQVGVRRHAYAALEQADELERRQPGGRAQVLQPQVFGMALVDQVGDQAQQGPVARRRLDAPAAAAMAAIQAPESGHQQF